MRAGPVRFFPYFAFLLAVLYFFSGVEYSPGHFPLDDAWIHMVYARSFAQGNWLAYNDGIQEAGATSLLWVVLSAPAQWLSSFGISSVIAAIKLESIALVMGILAVASWILRRLGAGPLIAALNLSLFALNARLIFSALSGMENVLLVLLWIATPALLMQRRFVWASLCAGLAVITRPEAVLLAAALPFALLAEDRDRKAPAYAYIVWPVGLLFPAIWAIFCHSVNGGWLPNTFYVKAAADFTLGKEQLATLQSILSEAGISSTLLFAPALLALGAVAAVRHRYEERIAALYLVLLPVLYAMAVLGSRVVHAHGYYWVRYLDPALMILEVAAVTGMGLVLTPVVAVLRSGDPSLQGKKTIFSFLLAVLLGLLLVLSLPSLARSLAERKKRLDTDSRAIVMINEKPALWVRDNTPVNAVIAATDAGAARYLSGRFIIDRGGLNYSPIALKKETPDDVLKHADWLMEFTYFFTGQKLAERFELQTTFSIPMAEYTICNCPAQTEVVIAKAKKEGS